MYPCRSKDQRDCSLPNRIEEEFQVLRTADKPSAISTAWLNALLRLHLPPIKQVVFLRPYSLKGMRDLILGRVSHLDAFSGYLCQT